MRTEIVKLHKTIGATTIYVTHDQTEAMTMATKIVVLKDGRVQQIGSSEEIYSHPANLFVATFIGSPAMNICDGTLEGRDVTVGTGNQVLNFQVHDDIVCYHEQAITGGADTLTQPETDSATGESVDRETQIPWVVAENLLDAEA